MKDATIVVKIGGDVIDDPTLLSALVDWIYGVSDSADITIVHGGGRQASRLATMIGHTAQMVAGRRVTTETDLQTILWGVRGQASAMLVAALQSGGLGAIGLGGMDARVVEATVRPPVLVDGEMVDFGFVGDVVRVHPGILELLMNADVVPVVASTAWDVSGGILNVNADTIAADVAIALNADAVHFVSGVGGLKAADGSVVSVCNRRLAETGERSGWITDGMRVKVQNALRAAEFGIDVVSITGTKGLTAPAFATRVTAGNQAEAAEPRHRATTHD